MIVHIHPDDQTRTMQPCNLNGMNPQTSLPTSQMKPAVSCPSVVGNFGNIDDPSMKWMSEPQSPVALRSIKTSRGPISGMGTISTFNPSEIFWVEL